MLSALWPAMLIGFWIAMFFGGLFAIIWVITKLVGGTIGAFRAEARYRRNNPDRNEPIRVDPSLTGAAWKAAYNAEFSRRARERTQRLLQSQRDERAAKYSDPA